MINAFEPGQKVRVGNDIGYIDSVRFVQAHPSGVIPLHRIVWTHKRIRGLGQNYTVAPSTKAPSIPNCSFIEAI